MGSRHSARTHAKRQLPHMPQFFSGFRFWSKQLLVTCIYLTLLVFGCLLPRDTERASYLVVVLIAAVVAQSKHRAARHIALGLVVVSFILAYLFAKDIYYDLLLVVICIIILVHSAISVIMFLSRSETISSNEILGLINCYIIIGFIWAFIYTLSETLHPGSFKYDDKNILPIDTFMYFSFSTLTTVGYGDVTPATPIVQKLCMVEAVSGQFYFALVVAYLLNKYSQFVSNKRKISEN